MAEKKITKFLQYFFTQEEKAEIALDLARETSNINRLEDRKSQVTAQYSAEIKAAKAAVNAASEKLNSGYEHREIECSVEYHDPKWGKKSYFRKDTGEFVGSETMTLDELEALPGMRPGEEIEPEPDAALVTEETF